MHGLVHGSTLGAASNAPLLSQQQQQQVQRDTLLRQGHGQGASHSGRITPLQQQSRSSFAVVGPRAQSRSSSGMQGHMSPPPGSRSHQLSPQHQQRQRSRVVHSIGALLAGDDGRLSASERVGVGHQLQQQMRHQEDDLAGIFLQQQSSLLAPKSPIGARGEPRRGYLSQHQQQQGGAAGGHEMGGDSSLRGFQHTRHVSGAVDHGGLQGLGGGVLEGMRESQDAGFSRQGIHHSTHQQRQSQQSQHQGMLDRRQQRPGSGGAVLDATRWADELGPPEPSALHQLKELRGLEGGGGGGGTDLGPLRDSPWIDEGRELILRHSLGAGLSEQGLEDRGLLDPRLQGRDGGGESLRSPAQDLYVESFQQQQQQLGVVGGVRGRVGASGVAGGGEASGVADAGRAATTLEGLLDDLREDIVMSQQQQQQQSRQQQRLMYDPLSRDYP